MTVDEELGTAAGEEPPASEKMAAAVEDTAVTAGERGVRAAEELWAAAGGVGLGLRVLEAAAGCLVLAGGVTEATGMTCNTSNGCDSEHCNHGVASWHASHSTSAGTEPPVLQAADAYFVLTLCTHDEITIVQWHSILSSRMQHESAHVDS